MTAKIAFVREMKRYASAYGQVYRGSAEILQKRAGARVRSFFTSPRFLFREQAYLDEELTGLTDFNPHVVFCDPNVLVTSQVEPEEQGFESVLLKTTRGKLERTILPAEGEITIKDGFYRFCIAQGIPTPKTVLLRDFSWQDISHEVIARMFGRYERALLIYKHIYGASGKDVFRVSKERQLLELMSERDFKKFIVQERIPVGPIPFSMRIVTFAGEIIGGALLANPSHHLCSNAHQGGIAFDLALPEEEKGREFFPEKICKPYLGNPNFWNIFRQAGIDPFDRRIPNTIASYSRTMGMYPGNSLLRGTDFIFEEAGSSYALESNAHPGPPGTGMWQSITGKKLNGKSKIDQEIEIASELIARAILRLAA